ncbi:MAG: hypothetical protein KDB65_02490 [Calditrichaeota bacterium]|nr:hypothetical protein [Calditrichota bacterium]MCB9368007.1 hypothetical protein [Calditrichota bacterium]
MALIGASIDILSNNLLASVMRIVEDAKAKDKVYLVSPYLQFNTNLEDVLDKAAKEGVDVRLIYRKGYELKAEDRKYLATSKIDFRCLEHLHAKLYVSDFTALVTSLNLYNYSDKESRELGILIKDSKSVRSLFDTAEAWWDKADKVDKAVLLNRNLKQTKSSTEKQSEVGFCIRCRAPKAQNQKYPLCDSCYKEWAKFKNPEYEEKYCHRCGEKHKSSVAKPLCKSCWSALNR